MDNNIDNLKRLIEKIRTVGFFERLFGWRKIKNQLIDAAADMHKMAANNDHLQVANSKLETEKASLLKYLELANNSLAKSEFESDKLRSDSQRDQAITGGLKTQIASKNTVIESLKDRIVQLEKQAEGLNRDHSNLHRERDNLKEQNAQLLSDEDARKQKYEKDVAVLNLIREQIQHDRSKEMNDKNNAELERIRNLKDTWNRHEENVKSIIKTICQRHTVQYIDKVPFTGNPDNTLMIADEYIVFDAKSPGSDDVSNFPNYLKDQAEKAKKYAQKDGVKSDIFFVVPSNILDFLNIFVYRHGDHNVFIISVDALEPVILALKKIEEYEFADQLSPDDRESICRVLGRFAHLSKRRIQVDSFFAKQFLELAYKCETDLPEDILNSVIEYEKADKLNPPLEKRAKAIPVGDLEKENTKMKHEAEGRGIIIEEENISNSLNNLPLYKE